MVFFAHNGANAPGQAPDHCPEFLPAYRYKAFVRYLFTLCADLFVYAGQHKFSKVFSSGRGLEAFGHDLVVVFDDKGDNVSPCLKEHRNIREVPGFECHRIKVGELIVINRVEFDSGQCPDDFNEQVPNGFFHHPAFICAGKRLFVQLPVRFGGGFVGVVAGRQVFEKDLSDMVLHGGLLQVGCIIKVIHFFTKRANV